MQNKLYIKDYVSKLSLRTGQTHRGNCPACGGRNTFTAAKDGGTLVWNCYRAQCGVHGGSKAGLTISEINKSNPVLGVSNTARIPATVQTREDNFHLPDYFTSALGNNFCRRCIDNYHLVTAYADRRADIRYDPKQNRCVFVIKDHEGNVCGAAGRALNYKDKPKWFMYHQSQLPFTCLGKEFPAIGCIVEDAISATAVSCVTTGIALLGSSLQKSLMQMLQPFQFKKLIVALDKDASLKALQMQRILTFYVPASILLLDDDIKYLKPDQIRRKLEKLL